MMKKIFVIMSLLTSTLSLADIYMIPGESRYVGREMVSCLAPGTTARLYACVYNYTDSRWGIHVGKNPSEQIATMRALQACSDHNGKRCKQENIRCEQESTNPHLRYTCQYTQKKFGTFTAEATTRVEAEALALRQCETTNKSDCKSEFVTCDSSSLF